MRTIDLIRGTRIEKIVQESSNVRSFYFRDDESKSFLPGQFAMVWLPGVGEFPMSLSVWSKSGLSSIGVKAMGKGSKKLYECKDKDPIGVRGPYGNSFDVSTKLKRVLLVGGGTGMIPMVVLAGSLAKKRIRTSMIIGARTKEELPFLKLSTKLLGRRNVFPSTDDGSL
ncbi:MAG: dihydroorotate dehydrogenase electron transfer subunit, partial [Nitrososphaerales archaeon]